MEIFLFIAVFLLLRRIIKVIKFTPLRAGWSSILNIASGLLWVLYYLNAQEVKDPYSMLVAGLFLGGVLYYFKKNPDFDMMRFYIESHYPLLAVTFIDFIADLFFPTFVDNHEGIFAVVILLAFSWIFARWASSKKQEEEFRAINQQNVILDKLVAERTAELTQQKDELQEAVKLLQTTQQQLIQSEKLASLGELTAGIAHEIQNPLNFVNNFSEVSMELIDEMGEELAKGDTEEAMAIANDIKQNLEKIRHHGKRADGIVKGMLQHSRASSDVQEPTNVNNLADEYLRLAYHGLRAKDKSFNAELITHFDEGLPLIKIVPQDVGRVMLNMFNNAFYAVQQKQKTGLAGYKPTVEVTTLKSGQFLEIKVKDNGIGIPEEIKDKILQPFFTTKPTGEGTGLGLSLSYDIIVKAHGGQIDIDSVEGEFTAFIIKLPL
ncbi:sensor histidine kinase [Mucilaginibacter gilvus]|uniref:histidine kinase n=1 Tax=Mucilaginibacter gilvus TaxID=2305909 RepID=A0A444MRI0_9SPHI|nr:ATP-binding protein [Mucilaginibacter gilvus]RWY54237.1 GHKL domain-containing protein [Mucilaginibacter gilvus]